MIAYSPLAAFSAVFICGILLFAVGLAGSGFRGGAGNWITAALTVALSGYVVFWLGFWRPEVGRAASWILVGSALARAVWRGRHTLVQVRAHAPVMGIMLLTAVLYVGGLELAPAPSWSEAARTHFFAMPGDNETPRIFADVIRSGNRARILGGDWLTSDRPPLQTGVALLVLPVFDKLGFDLDTACAAAGFWLQLLWIPALNLLLRRLGVSRHWAFAAAAVAPFTGFLFFNSIYLWPKLAAAAFVIAAGAEWFLAPSGEAQPSRFWRAGACAACGWLLHGGIMFALVALAPFVFVAWREWRGWLWSALAFVLIVSPWLGYQHWYAPPGNRLVKWHIGGDIGPDDLSFVQAVKRSYVQAGWSGAWRARRDNVKMLVGGNWGEMAKFWQTSDAAGRRLNEQAFPLRTAAMWWLALAGLPVLLARLWRNPEHDPAGAHAAMFALGWLVLTLVVWVGLMFFPSQVFTHQGTYTTQLLLIALLLTCAIRAHPAIFAVVAAIEVTDFVTTWLRLAAPASPAHNVTPALMLAVAATAGLVATALWFSVQSTRASTAPARTPTAVSSNSPSEV